MVEWSASIAWEVRGASVLSPGRTATTLARSRPSTFMLIMTRPQGHQTNTEQKPDG